LGSLSRGDGEGAEYVLREVGGRCLLDVPGAPEPVVAECEDLGSHLLSAINHHACYGTTSALVVHAGVVARGDDVVVIPGRPDAGKSTLVTALVRSGLDYLSDEALAIDLVTGEVIAYPKAISLDPGSWPLFPDLVPEGTTGVRHHVPPESVRSGCVGTTGRIRVVVSRRYVPGAPTTLEPLSRAGGVALLADHAFTILRRSDEALALLDDATVGASCHRLTGGDLDEAVEAIMNLLDGSPP
jgi:hypothetical protein